jgi:hypothetical protein
MNLEIKAVFNEDEADDAALFLSGKWSQIIVNDTLQLIRNQLKYRELSEETTKALEEVRECIIDNCLRYGVPLA